MGETFVEKVFSKKIGLEVKAGKIVEVIPDVAMSHDNTAAIFQRFKEIGVDRVLKPEIHVVVLDHATPAPTEQYALNHKIIREFVKKYGISHFYDVNMGICHQVLIEEGFVLPGQIIVGSDSHTTTYGAIGAFGTGIGQRNGSDLRYRENLVSDTCEYKNYLEGQIATRNRLQRCHPTYYWRYWR